MLIAFEYAISTFGLLVWDADNKTIIFHLDWDYDLYFLVVYCTVYGAAYFLLSLAIVVEGKTGKFPLPGSFGI